MHRPELPHPPPGRRRARSPGPAAAVATEARGLLGTPEAELAGSVRIARRGGEGFALTDDYVLGRDTVELDEVDGTYVVTSVTVELPDGPRTFTRRR